MVPVQGPPDGNRQRDGIVGWDQGSGIANHLGQPSDCTRNHWHTRLQRLDRSHPEALGPGGHHEYPSPAKERGDIFAVPEPPQAGRPKRPIPATPTSTPARICDAAASTS